MIARFLFLFAMFWPTLLAAQPQDGRYVFTAEGRAIASIEIEAVEDTRRVTYRGPLYSLSARELTEIELPGRTSTGTASAIDAGMLTVTLASADQPGRTVRIERVDADHLAITYVDSPIAPLLFSRSDAPLVADRIASELPLEIDNDWPDNPEVTALFEADQAARQGAMDQSREEGRAMARADAERRVTARAMLDAGAIRSGRDFYHAAFVFQHGAEPADYLLAHVLATSAMARGYDRAAWIAAATLDRYLGSIGQPQIYGTQYSGMIEEATGELTWSMGDYDGDLLTDNLRMIHAVPPRASQEERLEEYRTGE